MAPRLFALDEAESLLPHLTGLISEMRELRLQHGQLLARLAAAGARARSNGNIGGDEARAAERELERKAAAVNGLMEQVRGLGCELKGIEEGLVDFRTVREDGREVYLCWKLGEPAIEWWHELDAGFAGRQPLRE